MLPPRLVVLGLFGLFLLDVGLGLGLGIRLRWWNSAIVVVVVVVIVELCVLARTLE